MFAGMSPFFSLRKSTTVRHLDDSLGVPKAVGCGPINLLESVWIQLQLEAIVDEMILLQLCYEFASRMHLASRYFDHYQRMLEFSSCGLSYELVPRSVPFPPLQFGASGF